MYRIELNEHTKSDRAKWAWTKTNVARSNDIVEIFEKYRRYWPLTERFSFYRLISSRLVTQSHWGKNGKAENGSLNIYKSLPRLLKWMRIDERLPWEAVVDDNRILTGKVGFSNPEEFIEYELDDFLTGYRRCLAHRQKYYIEIWIEKAALLNIVKPIADKYCRRVMCCRGYNSVTFQAEFFNRASESLARGQKPVVLYFGDWDPSGENMIYAAAQTLIDELGLFGTEFYRCGINPEDFDGLQANPEPVVIKKKDSRAKKFVEQYGRTAYELDAFEPEELQARVESCIRTWTDMDALKQDLENEPYDYDRLGRLRDKVIDLVASEL